MANNLWLILNKLLLKVIIKKKCKDKIPYKNIILKFKKTLKTLVKILIKI